MTGATSGPRTSDPSHVPVVASLKNTKIALTVLVAIQLALYGYLCWLSRDFQYGSVETSRPLGTVLVVLGVAFAAYLLSIPAALRLSHSKRAIAGLVFVAMAMRLVVVSEPIQEVDLYRYIWDGAVSNQRISPYEFSPTEVRRATTHPPKSTDARGNRLRRLAAITQEQPSLRTVLERVHYGQVRTVYPPVSQFVFRTVDWLTPANSNVAIRIGVMKSVMVVADLGVMLLLLWILILLKINAGWSIAYGWSPLVIKEFANSGHLDSIAMFLCMASLACLAAVVVQRDRTARRGSLLVLSSGVFLGLGIGAKLYPIVLLPLAACLVWRRKGARWSLSFIASAGLTSVIVLAPMLRLGEVASDPPQTIATSQSLDGLTTFLSRWEINDLIFMVVQENIRPENSLDGQPSLWFAVTNDSWRIAITQRASQIFSGDVERMPFLLTRLVTTAIFGVIVLAQCRRTWHDPSLFLESAFLILAWFWLLSPTQNPWYWCWALPLIPLARNRLWLLMSGLTLIYYTRFWFDDHPQFTWGSAQEYRGVEIFDFIIVWIEFFPFLLLLLLNWVLKRFAAVRPNRLSDASEA